MPGFSAGYINDVELGPTYESTLEYAGEVLARALKHAEKGSTITVEKHADGCVGVTPVVTVTIKTQVK